MLTWEAKKEAIFEMPVRGRGVSEVERARRYRALRNDATTKRQRLGMRDAIVDAKQRLT